MIFKLLNCVLVLSAAAGIALAVAGTGLRWSPPPVPAGWEAPAQAVAPAQSARGGSGRERVPVPLARSVPVAIEIPAIHVRARVIRLGLTRSGGMAVPPLARPFLAGWYKYGPAPGQRGAAVIVGHVDAAAVGPAVFYYLGDLRPGQFVYVRLTDGQTVAFVVFAAAIYQKATFPVATVYGPTKLPTLRLITCGGAFDRETGHYLSNIVVFANYVGPVPAQR